MITYPEIMDVSTTNQMPQLVIPGVLDNTVLRQAIDSARDGITISDARLPDMPLVYVNPAFTSITGYSGEEILGLNCRFLQGDDTLQPEVDVLRRAFSQGSSCQVTLRNYRRDGVLFHNELSVSPVRDADGVVTHFVGIQKDVSRRVRAERRLQERDRELQDLNLQLEKMTRCDGLTGLLNRRAFDDGLDQQWRRCLREGGKLTVYMVDIDHFKRLNDRHGHLIGDACLRRVAEGLNKNFARAADLVARYGGEEFVILNAGMSACEAATRGQHILKELRTLALPPTVGHLTVSIGVATTEPIATHTPEALLGAADSALYEAKAAGRDTLIVAPAL